MSHGVSGCRLESSHSCLLLAGGCRLTLGDSPWSDPSPEAEPGWHVYRAAPFTTLVQVSPASDATGGDNKEPAFIAYRR
jgi:hypothetical protein